ncbi:hypothetical protein EYC98_07560 [Halieaceae bacterium IMCC14734]|uniref:Alginate export domain-containing protein n=1 Tax=Candidatus Litorirhabdus singularis TaxID=2518993 RepID=A0ABT3TFE2_9GAMM|nr:alginate export family protein [Candidatus Litorirhabdus singularis]MCX2980734.1 hypothetical protein [Candidatus Litorirhabdus singularis]
MSKTTRVMITTALLPLALATSVQAADNFSDGIASMVSDGKASVDFRYRFEGVDDENFDKDAKASTLRSRLTLETAAYKGFTAKLEFDNVSDIGSDEFNSTTNGNAEYPVVADPEGTDLNQAWAAYQFNTSTATFGRQRITHGSQRFIGGVAWRQNEQTYDGLRAVIKPIESLAIDLSYVSRINRIFGPNDGAQPSKWKGDNWWLRADYSITDKHTLTGFAYRIDVDEQDGYASGRTVDNSNDTYGIDYRGSFGPVSVAASAASQTESGKSNLSYDADYYMVELGAKLVGVNFKAAYEVLGSDNGVGFKTPLATLHKFQGWADKFLATPADGIEDAWIGATGKAGPLKLGAFYHDFAAESSSVDYGTEIDLVATWPATKVLTLQAKYAKFSADNSGPLTDTEKFWLTAQLKL